MATTGFDRTREDEFLGILYQSGELLAKGQLEEAKVQLERARAIDADDAKAKSLLALTYFKLGLFAESIALYASLVQDNPSAPALRVNLGLVYLKAGDFHRALKEFRKAVEIEPTHAKAHNYLGLTLAKLGDFEQARAHFLKAGSEPMAEKMRQAMMAKGAQAAVEAQSKRTEAFTALSSADDTKRVEDNPPFQRAKVAEVQVATDEDTLRRVFSPPKPSPEVKAKPPPLPMASSPTVAGLADGELPVLDDIDVTVDVSDSGPSPAWLTASDSDVVAPPKPSAPDVNSSMWVTEQVFGINTTPAPQPAPRAEGHPTAFSEEVASPHSKADFEDL